MPRSPARGTGPRLARAAAAAAFVALQLAGCSLIAPFASSATDSGTSAGSASDGDVGAPADLDAAASDADGLVSSPDLRPPPDLGGAPPTFGPLCAAGWCWVHPPATAFYLRDVWRDANGDVYVVGPYHFMLRYRGGSWSALPYPAAYEPRSIWGASPDIHIGTKNRASLHWTGTRWTQQQHAINGLIVGLGGTTRTDVYGLFAGVLWRFDGALWTPFRDPAPIGTLSHLAVHTTRMVAGNGLVVASRVATANGWSTLSPPSPYQSMWADRTNIAVGTNKGAVLFNNIASGTSWTTATVFGTTQSVLAIWGDASGIYAAGSGGVLAVRANSGSWKTTMMTRRDSVLALDGRSGVVNAVGTSGSAYLYSGGAWRDLAPGSRAVLSGVAAHDDTLYAVGLRGYFHRAKGDLAPTWVPANEAFTDVWADASGAIAISEDPGGIYTLQGTSYKALKSGTAALHGIGGVSTSLFAVGAAGTIYQRGPGTQNWFAVSSGTSATLRAVDAVSTMALAVGDNGTVLLRDSTSWKAMPFPSSKRLEAVKIISPNDAWAAGEGVVARYQSGKWQLVTPSTLQTYVSICGRSSSKLVVLTKSGKVYAFDGSKWGNVTLSDKSLAACRVDVQTRQGWAVGTGGAILTRPL